MNQRLGSDAPAGRPEVWLRGALEGVPPLLQPVAHSLLQSREEVERLLADLSAERIWDVRSGAASIGFHVLHAIGSLDRLFTYARGAMLSDAQLQILAQESQPDADLAATDLLAAFEAAVVRAIDQLRETSETTLTAARGVGRAGLPSTVGGLLFHAAEHTQRHVGQALTTSKLTGRTRAGNADLLDALLDSWDRSNTILVNLLRALPDGAFDLRATAAGPSIAELFTHVHFVRLVFVKEDAPDMTVTLPEHEWVADHDVARVSGMLNDSARDVREAVRSRVAAGREMALHYDHPILFLQHMLWHEGYHHGQIKLTLKLAGRAVPDDIAGPITWRVWTGKT